LIHAIYLMFGADRVLVKFSSACYPSDAHCGKQKSNRRINCKTIACSI